MRYSTVKATIKILKSKRPSLEKYNWIYLIARNYGTDIAFKLLEKYQNKIRNP